jgi:glycosyltransferase involved in cell wall biosynthesis
MACALPVVAAAVGVGAEIIENGPNGLPASTEQEWIEELEYFLTSGELRRRFGKASRSAIGTHHSLGVRAATLAATLRGVLERSRRGDERTVR